LTRTVRWLALLAALAWLPGCAGVPSGGSGAGAPATPQVVREDAPATYDALVAELAAYDGHFLEARDAFQRASRKDPDSAFLQRRLARLSLKLEDLDAAVAYASRALELAPDDEATRLFLARIHRIRLDLPAVEAVLLDEQGKPISPDAVLLLYQVYLERNRLADALAITKQLVAERPDLLEGHMALATVYEQMGRREDAVATIRAAMVSHPGRPVLYGRLARMLRALGDHQAEIELYREVLAE